MKSRDFFMIPNFILDFFFGAFTDNRQLPTVQKAMLIKSNAYKKHT